jgi:hypothetical protein
MSTGSLPVARRVLRSPLWRCSLALAALALLLAAVIDLASVWQVRDAGAVAASMLVDPAAAPGHVSCTLVEAALLGASGHAKVAEPPAGVRRSACAAKEATGVRDVDLRIRVERHGDTARICTMWRRRAPTGLLAPLVGGVATARATRVTDSSLPSFSEAALVGHGWRFCTAEARS